MRTDRHLLISVFFLLGFLFLTSLYAEQVSHPSSKSTPVSTQKQLESSSDLQAIFPSINDYTQSWWKNGSPQSGRNRRGNIRQAANDHPIFCVATGYYQLAFETNNARLFLLQENKTPVPPLLYYPSENFSETIDSLLSLSVEWNGNCYYAEKGALSTLNSKSKNLPLRLIESGRFLQRFDFPMLIFESRDHQILPVKGRLEVLARPQSVTLVLEIEASEAMQNLTSKIFLESKNLPPRFESTVVEKLNKGNKQITSLTLFMNPSIMVKGTPPIEIESKQLSPISPNQAIDFLQPQFRPQFGDFEIPVPILKQSNKSQIPFNPQILAQLDRLQFTLRNRSSRPQTVPLTFTEKNMSVTGLVPMIRDLQGNPTGIPMQTSKNWHSGKSAELYDASKGAWMNAHTQLQLPAESQVTLEYTCAYGHWGGIPSVSQSQLCLIGYGHNQLWEQVAIGSWGETICYEPDAVMGGCVITDIRGSLMKDRDTGNSYQWTGNVGGGDFLMLIDPQGKYRYPLQAKIQRKEPGPNLTDATLTGKLYDDAIEYQIRMQTPRLDDFHRTFFTIRYDILRDIDFQRLAFFQLGADFYNCTPFKRFAYGNEKGVEKEWEPKPGENAYETEPFPIEGKLPWFSLHQVEITGERKAKALNDQANRGLIIRSYRSKLNGLESTTPYAALFRSLKPSGIVLEIAPPPKMKSLKAGDFVEMELELMVTPKNPEDYYGGNQRFIENLKLNADQWKIVHQEAVDNNLVIKMKKGVLVRKYPIEIDLENGECDFEIHGGAGLLPISFSGAKNFKEPRLVRVEGAKEISVDQSVHGKDFWQTAYDEKTSTWRITYNIPSGDHAYRFYSSASK